MRRSTLRQLRVPLSLLLLATLLLQADRAQTVQAWALPSFPDPADGSRVATPTPLRAAAIAGGSLHTMAVTTKGTVVERAGYLQLLNFVRPVSPSTLRDIITVAAGRNFSIALSSEGALRIWGLAPLPLELSVPLIGGRVISIDAGLAMLESEVVAVWGKCAVADSLPAGLDCVVELSASLNHALALRVDETVVGWGDTPNGQDNVPDSLSGAVGIAASLAGVPGGIKAGNHYLALRSNGSVVVWGSNDKIQTECLRI